MLIETNKEKPAFVIFALNLASKDVELKALAHYGIAKFKSVEGVYKGQKERSYRVNLKPLTGFDDFQKILYVARHFNQESVLFVDLERNAELVYMDKDTKPTKIGKFQNVSKFEAEASDAYTFDPTTNYYYLAK